MPDTVETLLKRNLHEVFGERDVEKRREAIAQLWTEDCVFIDQSGKTHKSQPRFYTSRAFLGERRHFTRGKWSVEKIALQLITAEQRQYSRLLLRFDAFRDYFHSQRLRERDDAAHDYRLGAVVGDRDDERAIDLQRVDRQPGEIREGRITDTEVVERDADSQSAQRSSASRNRCSIEVGTMNGGDGSIVMLCAIMLKLRRRVPGAKPRATGQSRRSGAAR